MEALALTKPSQLVQQSALCMPVQEESEQPLVLRSTTVEVLLSQPTLTNLLLSRRLQRSAHACAPPAQCSRPRSPSPVQLCAARMPPPHPIPSTTSRSRSPQPLPPPEAHSHECVILTDFQGYL